MKIITIIFILFISSLLALTNVTKNSSDADRDKILKQILIDNFEQDGINLTGYKKLYSMEKDNLYYIEYEAVIEFMKDGLYSNIPVVNTSVRPGNNWFGERISKGQLRNVKTSVVFRKTENGWEQLSLKFH